VRDIGTILIKKRITIYGRIATGLLFLLAFSGTALADKQENEARKSYDAGFKASEANEFEMALEHYNKSYTILPRPRTMYNIAFCEDELGRGQDAILHFSEFLRLATERDEEFRSLASSRILVLKRKYYGTLTVKSRPSHAEVFIDGETTGSGHTPLQLSLPPGQHKITVVPAGSLPATRTVTLQAGKSSTEFIRASKATLSIVVTPADATVELEEQPGVARDHRDVAMEPGTYRFRIRSPGYRTKTIAVTLKSDTQLEEHVTLEVLASSVLLVKSHRAGATVSIDGQVIGLTQHSEKHTVAAIESKVTAGEHVLMIELGTTSLHKRVHTSPGEKVTVSLEPSGAAILHSKGLIWGMAGVGAASLAVGAGLGLHSLLRGSGADGDPMEQDAARGQALLGDLLVLGGGGALLGARALSNRNETELTVFRSLLPSHESETDAR